MKLYAIALSSCLALATFAANADILPGNAISGFDTGTIKLAPGSFTNDWTFTLPGSQEFDVNAFQVKFNSTYNLSNTTLELFQGNLGHGTMVGVPYNVTQDTNGFSYSHLSGGNYYFQIAGLADGVKGGKYDLQAVANPVPEPSTYALIGVGLIGLIASRRRKVNMSLFA